MICRLALWLHIAERIVGWTLGNDPDRDRAHVLARIDEVTAERRITPNPTQGD